MHTDKIISMHMQKTSHQLVSEEALTHLQKALFEEASLPYQTWEIPSSKQSTTPTMVRSSQLKGLAAERKSQTMTANLTLANKSAKRSFGSSWVSILATIKQASKNKLCHTLNTRLQRVDLTSTSSIAARPSKVLCLIDSLSVEMIPISTSQWRIARGLTF